MNSQKRTKSFLFVYHASSVRGEELCTAPDKKPSLAQLFRAPLLREGDAALRWEGLRLLTPSDFFQSSPRFSMSPLSQGTHSKTELWRKR